MIDTHTTNWTEGLSLFWGLYMIVAGLLILFMPNLRDRASETLQSKSGRTFLASICFLVTLIHLGVYQGLYEGSDLLLITIGYLSAIKGLILLTSPTVLAITEKVLVSEYISGWFLLIMILGAYLLNKSFHFIT
jgi:uncharacterized membrane protein HdeD (DUF308 family)